MQSVALTEGGFVAVGIDSLERRRGDLEILRWSRLGTGGH